MSAAGVDKSELPQSVSVPRHSNDQSASGLKQSRLSGHKFIAAPEDGRTPLPIRLVTVLLPWPLQRKEKAGTFQSRLQILSPASYQRKWAKALLACAILCTSSRLRMAFPCPW